MHQIYSQIIGGIIPFALDVLLSAGLLIVGYLLGRISCAEKEIKRYATFVRGGRS